MSAGPRGEAGEGSAAGAPELSVVIPSWNTRELLATCLEKLFAADLPTCEVIVVDNGSEDDSAGLVRESFPDVTLLENAENEGFARACNRGMEAASGRWVLLLNTDTEVAPDAVRRMLDFLAEHPEYGAAAPRLVHGDGRVQKSCHRFPNLATCLFFSTPLERWWPRSPEMRRYFMLDWDHAGDRDVDQPPAAVLLLRREALERVGLFDPDLWLFYNDVDLSLRLARDGWRTRYLGDAVVVHHEGASTSKFGDFVSVWLGDRLRYYRKHHGTVGALWLKACVGFAWSDYVVQQIVRKLRGRPSDPLSHLTRIFVRFLRQ